MLNTKSCLFVGLLAVIILGTAVLPASAQNTTVLSANSGDGNSVWFIKGEPSLVMNGFDLAPLGIARPIVVEQVSLSVVKPVPGSAVEVLVYQDANGGSPADAALVARSQATVSTEGTFAFAFNAPVVINEPVVWIGFYLPVGFEFNADTSGTSVLTYWAWGGSSGFDPGSLASATVLGPADGTAPVNLDMKGIARITARIRTAGETDLTQAGVGQVTGRADIVLTPPLVPYEFCSPVLIDMEDVGVTLHQNVALYCRVSWIGFAPESPAGYERRGFFFEIFAFGSDMPSAGKLPAPVTHCIRPAPEDLETAVLGVAWGAPRWWHILPTQRYGDVVCAEIGDVGFLSYFVPVSTG